MMNFSLKLDFDLFASINDIFLQHITMTSFNWTKNFLYALLTTGQLDDARECFEFSLDFLSLLKEQIKFIKQRISILQIKSETSPPNWKVLNSFQWPYCEAGP